MVNPIIDYSSLIPENVTFVCEHPIVYGNITVGYRHYLSDGTCMDIMIGEYGVVSYLRCTPVEPDRALTNREVHNIYSDMDNGMSYQEILRKYKIDPYIFKAINLRRIANKLDTDSTKISDDDIIKIYDLCKSGVPDGEIAEKFGIKPVTVRHIRNKEIKRYSVVLGEDRERIRYNTEVNGISEEEAVAIYKDLQSGMTGLEVEAKYDRSDAVITKIKFLRSPYTYLHDKYGFVPLESGGKAAASKELALTIYNDIKDTHISLLDAAKKYGVGHHTIENIKLCRGKYEFLKYEYHLRPIVG